MFTTLSETFLVAESTAVLQCYTIACYAERCTHYSKSVPLSVRLSVCHTRALYQNDSRYDHAVLTVRQPHDSSFLMVNVSAKFQREHI